MKTVLVTGGSGFIGSRLVLRLIEAGWNVLVTAINPSESLCKELGVSKIYYLDVLNSVSFDCQMPIDAIVHCATANDIISRDFNAGINLSVIGTKNMLEFAVQNNITKFLFFSTLQVYGTELQGYINEATPVKPEGSYALNHYFGEEVCQMYSRNYDINIALLRPANVYGVPDVSTVERDTLVPMCFVQDALRSGCLTLRSSGNQKRNFVSTDEVVDACLSLLDDLSPGCNPIIIGSRWHARIVDIAKIVQDVYRKIVGEDLRIEILSKEPVESNLFTLGSILESHYAPEDASRNFMYSVINRLFEYYQKKKRRTI